MNIEVKEQLDSVHRAMVGYWGSEFFTADRLYVNVVRRQMFVWVATRLVPDAKVVDIAEYMGKSHCTVIYSLSHVGDLMDVYPDVRKEMYSVLNHARLAMEDDVLGVLAQPGYEV